MLDVSKRGVLDRRMTILHFFLHIMTRFTGHGKICLQNKSNSANLQYMEDTGRSKIR